MKNSSNASASISSDVKADPFAIADLDRLADEIIQAIQKLKPEAGIDLSPVENLAHQMKHAAAAVTNFFIEQA